MANSFFSDPQRLKMAFSIATSAANAALGTNISLPTAQLAEMIPQALAAMPYYKAKGQEALGQIKNMGNLFKGLRGNIPSSGDTPPTTSQGRDRARQQMAGDTKLNGPFAATGSKPADPGRDDKTPRLEDKDTIDQKEQGRIARKIAKVKQNFRRKKAEREKTEKRMGAAGQARKIGYITFLALFGLGAIKDVIDFLSLGLIGIIINVVVIMGIILVVSFSGSSVKDFFSKKKEVLLGSAALEFVPFVSFIPIWTLAIVWMFIESRRGKKTSLAAIKRYSLAKVKKIPKLAPK